MTADDSPPADALRDAFEEIVFEWPDVTNERLFGFPAYRAGETVFAVLGADGVALTRLPAAATDEVAAEFATRPFEAYGQTIGRWTYVLVPAGELDRLGPFVRESYERARSGTTSVPPPEEGP